MQRLGNTAARRRPVLRLNTEPSRRSATASRRAASAVGLIHPQAAGLHVRSGASPRDGRRQPRQQSLEAAITPHHQLTHPLGEAPAARPQCRS